MYTSRIQRPASSCGHKLASALKSAGSLVSTRHSSTSIRPLSEGVPDAAHPATATAQIRGSTAARAPRAPRMPPMQQTPYDRVGSNPRAGFMLAHPPAEYPWSYISGLHARMAPAPVHLHRRMHGPVASVCTGTETGVGTKTPCQNHRPTQTAEPRYWFAPTWSFRRIHAFHAVTAQTPSQYPHPPYATRPEFTSTRAPVPTM